MFAIRATEWHETSTGMRMPQLRARLVSADRSNAATSSPNNSSPNNSSPNNSSKDEGVRLWPTSGAWPLPREDHPRPRPARTTSRFRLRAAPLPMRSCTVVSDARHPVPAAAATVEALTSVSSITGGIAVSADNLEPLVQHFRGLPSSQAVRQVHPARTMFFLIAFVALASAEWTMRRRRGLR